MVTMQPGETGGHPSVNEGEDFMRRSKGWLAALGFGAAACGAAWIGSRYSPRDPDTRDWYAQLKKPPFNPPDSVFPVAWTALYSLIAFSGWRVWQQDDSPERSAALRLWAAQLVANAEWTRIFFGERRPRRALLDVLSLELAIVAYILEAKRVDRAAAACFLPYAAWVAFAALLNEEIVRRNPEAEGVLPDARIT